MQVVSYDISSDKIRRKIAKLMEGYGVRIQYSVFECNLQDKRYREMYSKLLELTSEIGGGSVRIYNVCEKCSDKTITIGNPIGTVKKLSERMIIV